MCAECAFSTMSIQINKKNRRLKKRKGGLNGKIAPDRIVK